MNRYDGVVRWILLAICLSCGARGEELTFFAWSDQHVKADGDGRHLAPAIAAMRRLPGKAYPTEMGGVVERPAFVLGCGDCTDWPTRAAVRSYERAVGELGWPSYEIMGNHDEGDGSGMRMIDEFAMVVGMEVGVGALVVCWWSLKFWRWRRTVRLMVCGVVALGAGWGAMVLAAPDGQGMRRWMVERHGEVSYSFDARGVHFVMLFSKYNPRQEITAEALEFLRKDLARVPKGQGVIVASHYCFEAISNRDAYVDAMGEANVLLVMGGHYHQPTSQVYRGKRFVQIGSPRTGSTFTVVRVREGGVEVGVWDYVKGGWRSGLRVES